MTLEEKARLYLVNKFGLIKNISVNEIERNEELSGEFHAYIDGVTENGIIWHDLRKNPNDLPDGYAVVLNQHGVQVTYDYMYNVWRNDDANNYICEDVVAWTEIPKFEE